MKILFTYIFLTCNLFGTNWLTAQNNEDLVNLNAYVVTFDEKSFELEVRLDIADGWYLFVRTPEDTIFHSVQLFCELPYGCERFGETEQINVRTEQFGKDLFGAQYGIIFKQKFVRFANYEPQNISCSVLCQSYNLNFYTEPYMKEVTIKL